MTKENPETIAEYKDALDTVLAKVSSLETKLSIAQKQVDESTEAMTIMKKQFDAAAVTEKDAVIDELVIDSNGRLTKESLKEHNLKELYFLKDNLDKAEPKSFVSVMRQKEADAVKPKPQGTVGFWNPETKKWEGGIP